LARVQLRGPNPYDLAGEPLAWAATTAAAQQPARTGVMGPADLFGLDPLEEVCRSFGLLPSP
jgi:hypothetical protein